MAAVSRSISSDSFRWREKAVWSTSSTVKPTGYTGIWEMRPSRRFLAMTTSPSSASSSPVRMRKRVDLPAPLRPSSPTRSPVSTWKVMPSKILFPISKDFFSPFTLISIMIFYHLLLYTTIYCS